VATELISVSFLGVDERSRSAYEIFFNSIRKINFELIDDCHKAQLCLVDMDAYNTQQEYQALIEQHPDRYILILSLSEYTCQRENEFFIKKPVKRELLQDSLNQIYRKMSGKPAVNIDYEPSIPKLSITKQTTSKQSIPKLSNPRQSIPKLSNISQSIPKLSSENAVSAKEEKTKNSTVNVGKLLKVENEELFVGDQADVDINNPEQLKKIFYSPEKSLQSIIKKACHKSRQNEQIIQLTVLNHDFYFDHKEQKVYTSIGPGILRPLCLIHHDQKISFTVKKNSYRVHLHEILQTNKNKTAKKTLEKQSWNMESFMWLISLWSSRGRIPEGTDLRQAVYLLQWPNLTRLASIPHSVRIAALLYDQPYRLTEAAQQLGIEQRYVFAFYSACNSIGLANVSKRRVDQLFAAEKPQADKNKSILSKLASKLKNISEKISINNIEY